MYPTTSQNPRWQPSWLSNALATRKNSESECLAKEPETYLITIKPKTASYVARQLSWILLPYCSLPRCAFLKRILLCQNVCLLENSFLSVRQEPTLGPWKRPPSYNRAFSLYFCFVFSLLWTRLSLLLITPQKNWHLTILNAYNIISQSTGRVLSSVASHICIGSVCIHDRGVCTL